jgi:hypothetical protein
MSFIRSTKDFAGPLGQFFGGEQDPRARPPYAWCAPYGLYRV